MQKQVLVEEYLRDPVTNDIVGTNQALGITEDDGLTCVIPNGYVPNIETTPAEDIRVTLIPPQTLITPATLTSRVNDVEANTSTLTFTFP